MVTSSRGGLEMPCSRDSRPHIRRLGLIHSQHRARRQQDTIFTARDCQRISRSSAESWHNKNIQTALCASSVHHTRVAAACTLRFELEPPEASSGLFMSSPVAAPSAAGLEPARCAPSASDSCERGTSCMQTFSKERVATDKTLRSQKEIC